MNTIDSLAAILAAASFLPQGWKTVRTRDLSGISLVMCGLFTVGMTL